MMSSCSDSQRTLNGGVAQIEPDSATMQPGGCSWLAGLEALMYLSATHDGSA